MRTLETDRLILREFTLDDVEAFYQLGSDPAVTRFVGGSGFANLDEARTVLLERPLADYARHGFGRWACVLKSSGAVIGFAGLKYLEDLRDVDIGYRFLPAYWGQGLATEASRPAIAFGFLQLNLPHIIGLVDPDNVASVRVLQSSGSPTWT
jgi:RimJ/RimL family protein N-acetyltransferase